MSQKRQFLETTFRDQGASLEKKPGEVFHTLDLIGRTNNRPEDILGQYNDFETGISLYPPKGYSIFLEGTPELKNQGYMFQGGYQKPGEVIISLYKFNGQNVDLPLPTSCIRVFLRENIVLSVARQEASSHESMTSDQIEMEKLRVQMKLLELKNKDAHQSSSSNKSFSRGNTQGVKRTNMK